ncbi:3-hydroxyacyl-CoA dehydrogenase NAD-binding domain-containing protein [Lignipirellula cremea]|uniref:enoyl-CoA hydratase n=1 Tax=Lignipirellula cremea TaxID=2528010 RepID=A0A518E2H9_9BACT|nr:3-hydroxyacyl-CoA dehydrogenase NAD-binding domain-containing protein [Lignipirellula cremea]QDU98296.1 Fatty acid oxidation complex subunit alpha [Lignipirellula cremea]
MCQAATIQLSFPEPDIALLSFDQPDKGVNVLSSSVLAELDAHLDTLADRSELAGLILASGKAGTFIAGANLEEFVASLHADKTEIVAMCRRGQTLFGRLSQAPFVTVAAIDGVCVGGGAELAVWCDRRVLSDNPKTEIGFPEVKLGLFPGWGGTARTPRIVGLANAVEMITSGNSIEADAALEMGLASDIAPAAELQAAAIRLIRDEQQTGAYKKDRERWSQPLNISETELGFLGATAAAVVRAETKGQYPAPEAALNTMLEAAMLEVGPACELEAENMSDLFGSPVNAALLNVFFLTTRNKKDKGVDGKAPAASPIRLAAVIGAGIMGAGIAAANIKRGVPVVLSDAQATALAKGARTVLEEASYNRKTKSADVEKAIEITPLLNISQADVEIAGCDVVIEAVVENAEVKKKIFARLEPQLSETAILASNTSTLPITKLAIGLQHPERFCGIHFFNPVRRMKLVEVIRGEKTNDETVVAAVAYAKALGKSPIVVNDGPGFLVNRLLFPYLNESLALLSEGAAIKDIDRAARSFGMPMGPIELYDMVGIDTAVYAGATMWQAFPERVKPSPLLPAMLKAGRLGVKSGLGFFSYDNRKKKAQPDPTFDAFAAKYIEGDRSFTKEELENRLFMPMLLEATRVLQEGIVRDPRDVDLGLIFGLGFPPFKGGLLFWADTVGAPEILRRVESIQSVGKRVEPTQMLLDMARDDSKFYPQ